MEKMSNVGCAVGIFVTADHEGRLANQVVVCVRCV